MLTVTGSGPWFADPTRCPECGTTLEGTHCSVCQAQWEGPLAGQIWDASAQADHWIALRQRLITHHLQAQQVPTPTPAPSIPPGWACPPPPPPPVAAPGAVPTAHPQPRPPQALSVQHLLVGVGALLLAVAAVVFLAFSWSVMGLTGRALVLAGLTGAVWAVALGVRRLNLHSTAEALAGVAVVLVLLDAAAARATGLVGQQLPRLLYAGLAALLCAVAVGALGHLGRLRAATFSAAGLMWLAPLLLGAHLSVHVLDWGPAPWAVAAMVSCGLGLAAGRLPQRYRSEQHMLAGLALPSWLLGVASSLVTASLGHSLAAAVPLALACALGAGWAWRPGTLAPAAAPAAGAAGAVSLACAVAHWLDFPWVALVSVLLAAVVVAGLVKTRPYAHPWSGLAWGAASWPMLVAAVSLFVLLWIIMPVLAVGASAWDSEITRPWAQASMAHAPWWPWPTPATRLSALVALVVLAGLAALWAGVARPARRDRGWASSALLVSLAALGSPWQPQWPLVAVVASGVALTGCLGVAALRWSRRLEQTCTSSTQPAPPPASQPAAGAILAVAAVGMALLTLLAAWGNQLLALLVSLLASLAALGLRRRHPHRWWLVGCAAVGVMLVVAPVAAYLGMHDSTTRQWLAGLSAVLPGLAASALALPRKDRLTLVGISALGFLGSAQAASLMPGGMRPAAGLATCLATVLVAGGLLANPRLTWEMPLRAWGAVPVVVTGLALALVLAHRSLAGSMHRVALLEAGPGQSVDAVLICLAAAVALIVAAALCWSAASPPSPQPTPPTLAQATHWCATGLAVIGLALSISTPLLWVSLILVAVGLSVAALIPGQRWLAWLGWLCAALAWWVRLRADQPHLAVEVYTLAPALVLLGAGVWAARRDGRWLRPSLAAAAALLVLPSAALSATGPLVRPLLVLLGATLALAVALLVVRTHPQASLIPAMAAAVAAAMGLLGRAGYGALHSGAPTPEATSVEMWAGLATLLLAAVVLWAREFTGSASSTSSHWLPAAVGAPRQRGLPVATAMLALALTAPSLLAALSTPLSQGRTSLIARLAVAGGVWAGLMLVQAVRADPEQLQRQALDLTSMALGGGVVLTLICAPLAGMGLPTTPSVEWVCGPAGLLVALAGLVGLSRSSASPQGLGSWPWMGSGILLALLPSLWISSREGSTVRVVAVALAAAAVLMVGVNRRWQAPTVLGAGVLAVHGLVQLAPWISAAYSAVPRWVSIGTVGVLLLAVGARYEHRVAHLRALQQRIAALR